MNLFKKQIILKIKDNNKNEYYKKLGIEINPNSKISKLTPEQLKKRLEDIKLAESSPKSYFVPNVDPNKPFEQMTNYEKRMKKQLEEAESANNK